MPISGLQLRNLSARTHTLTQPAAQALGFLTVLSDGAGHLGGYLITNPWGRPLEFRVTSAVQPNKVQQILYGPTLGIYVGADLIGKTLIEKATTPVGLIMTDSQDVLEVRRSLDRPVVWVAPHNHPQTSRMAADGLMIRDLGSHRGIILAHPEFPDDIANTAPLFDQCAALDFSEPFTRIRDAIAEARRTGVTQRAAG